MKLFVTIIIKNDSDITNILNTWLNTISSLKKNFKNNNINFIFTKETIFEIIKKNTNDFNFICHSDVYVNLDNLYNYLLKFDYHKPLYIGGHGEFRKLDLTFFFHSHSPGIILSKEACNVINSQDNLLNLYKEKCLKYNKDLIDCQGVALGYFCNKFKIESITSNNIHFCNWKGEPCHIGKVDKNNLISCSNMNYQDMQEFHQYLNSIFDKKTFIICPSGGLGNILFQYFLGYTLEKEYDCTVLYRKNYHYWRGDIDQYQLFKKLNYIDLSKQNTTNFIDYHEKDFFYYDLELGDNEKNFIINGYYQSFKYSNKYIKEIRDELFNNCIEYNEMKIIYNNIKSETSGLIKAPLLLTERSGVDAPNLGSVSVGGAISNNITCLIHVRRGDYLSYQNIHPICNDEYYIKTINDFKKKYQSDNLKYLIFSDDIPFIQNWQVIKNLNYEIIYETNPERTLILMSLCDHFIIANSTLSLVAYLLRNNDDALLYAPKKWFGQDGYKYKIEDIIPENGILL